MTLAFWQWLITIRTFGDQNHNKPLSLAPCKHLFISYNHTPLSLSTCLITCSNLRCQVQSLKWHNSTLWSPRSILGRKTVLVMSHKICDDNLLLYFCYSLEIYQKWIWRAMLAVIKRILKTTFWKSSDTITCSTSVQKNMFRSLIATKWTPKGVLTAHGVSPRNCCPWTSKCPQFPLSVKHFTGIQH